MRLTYNRFQLGRYFQLHPLNQYGAYQWFLHHVGIARIVYDTELRNWRILPNVFNPATFPFLIFAFLFSVIWNGLRSTKDLSKDDFEFVYKLWEKRNDGSFRHIPFRKAPRLPLNKEDREGLKKRSWAKPYLKKKQKKYND